MRRRIIDGREKNCGNFENRHPANPSLNSKPSACDDRPHQRRNVCAICSKRCATENRKGIPYFVPACAFSTIGTKTIALPRKTVKIACHQFIPPSMSEDASMYVGTHAAIEIQSAAILHMLHLRSAFETGARSTLYRCESSIPVCTSRGVVSSWVCLYRSIRPDECKVRYAVKNGLVCA